MSTLVCLAGRLIAVCGVSEASACLGSVAHFADGFLFSDTRHGGGVADGMGFFLAGIRPASVGRLPTLFGEGSSTNAPTVR